MSKPPTIHSDNIPGKMETTILVEKKKENLHKRGLLNAITSWIDILAKLLVEFFIKPLIITTLGAYLYGVWQIINQMNSYMATVDIRSGTSVKWVIAKNRTISDTTELRKTMSAALLSNLLFLPIYLVAGGVLIWLAPTLTKVEPEYFGLVRTASAILVFTFIVSQYSFLFESVLAGMNLAYKRIGMRALITILGGIATVTVLYMGFSLPAMAVVALGIAIISGITFWWIVKKHVEWFGFARVGWKRIKDFFVLTWKFMLMKLVLIVNDSSDYILLGFLAGPKYVAAYAVTRYLTQAASRILKSIQTAVIPGLSKFVGEKNFGKLIEARKVLLVLNWFSITVIGSVILIGNHSFIAIWTEENLFVGSLESFLIVLIASLRILKDIESPFITMTLDIKKQTLMTGIIGLFSIILSFILIPKYEILGLLISLLLGTTVMALAYSQIAQQKMNGQRFIKELFFSRKSLVGILFLSFAGFLGESILVDGWLLLIGLLLLVGLLSSSFYWLLGLAKAERALIISNLKRINIKK